jgi:hypothetical protein
VSVLQRDRLVMTSKRKPSRGGRVRYKIDGVQISQQWYGGRWVTKIGHRIYHNAEFPYARDGRLVSHVMAAICDTCNGGFAELLLHPHQTTCSECRLEKAAELANYLESQGIPMGWGGHVRDRSQEYAREVYLQQSDSLSKTRRRKRSSK